MTRVSITIRTAGERDVPALIDCAAALRAERLPTIFRYERKGFMIEGCRRGAVAVDGTFVDALAMALVLEEVSK